MLIVCPACATSYMIDAASVGATGRMVRCARCKETWFASFTPGNKMAAFVNGVIAEAEAEGNGPSRTQFGAAAPAPEPAAVRDGDNFSAEAAPAADSAGLPDWSPEENSSASPDTELPPDPASISESPSLVPPPIPEPGGPGSESDDIETFAARRRRLQSKRKKSQRSSRWTALILVLVAFNVALIGARHEVVRYLPQTASLFAAIGLPVNLRELIFENVRITKETEGGATVLAVEGQIVSTGSKPVEVPRLRFAARDGGGQEVYVWTAKPERSILAAGESMKFSTRLAAPPPDAMDVLVRFFTAQDAMAAGGEK